MSIRARLLDAVSDGNIHRVSDLCEQGVTRGEIARCAREGLIVQVARGLYMSAELKVTMDHSLAVASAYPYIQKVTS